MPVTYSFRVCTLVLHALFVVLCQGAFGAEDRRELVEYCLAGINASREQLRSGEFSIQGTLTAKERDAGRGHAKIDVQIDCVFDADNLRFTRQESNFKGTYL